MKTDFSDISYNGPYLQVQLWRQGAQAETESSYHDLLWSLCCHQTMECSEDRCGAYKWRISQPGTALIVSKSGTLIKWQIFIVNFDKYQPFTKLVVQLHFMIVSFARINSINHSQGDQEKALGFEPLPLMDRAKAETQSAQSQVYFSSWLILLQSSN